MNKQVLSFAISTIILAGCGGGSDSSSKTAPQEIKVGVFTDSPVNGLFYETETQSGLTNEQGEFNYIEGESITFKLGNSTLGVATAQETITPFTLTGVKALTKQKEITNSFLNQSPNSFEKAINIATLLQGLDQDGNHDNGIDLANAHEILSDISIPLFIKSASFINNTQYIQARNRMQTLHSLNFIDAAENMYNSLDVAIESNLTAKKISNVNNSFFELIEFEYDSEDRVSAMKFDRNNDGVIDATQSFTYNQLGQLQTIYNSSNNTTQTLTYDNNNKLISRNTVNGNNIDLNEDFSYQGNLLAKFSLDTTSDGVSEFNTSYSYDSDNQLSGYQIDSDGDDQPDKTVTMNIENGKIKRFTEVKSGNTSLDIAYKYDSKGNRTSQNIQTENASSSFTNAQFTYDDTNNLTRYELDKDLDGEPDYIESYKYNQNKQRTQYLRDNNADGKWDFMAQYFYDINGNRVKMIEDSDGNGVVDKKWEANIQAAILNSTWEDISKEL